MDNPWIVLKYEFDKVWNTFANPTPVDTRVIKPPQNEFWSVQNENGVNLLVNVTREYANKFIQDMNKDLNPNLAKFLVARRQYYKY